MAAIGALYGRGDARRYETNAATRETSAVKWLILTAALSFFLLFLLMPLIAVFVEALRKGWLTYITAIADPDARSAIRLTLLVAVTSVPGNLEFGVAAAWAIAKFEFRG